MQRLSPGVFDNIGSFCDLALDEIKIWPAGRPRRNVSSVNKIFAANFYDSILKQKLACMPMSEVPIWRMLVKNIEYWEYILEHDEDFVILDEHFEEFDFWSQHVFYFEKWWHNNPNSRAEVIKYKPPTRIGAAVTR